MAEVWVVHKSLSTWKPYPLVGGKEGTGALVRTECNALVQQLWYNRKALVHPFNKDT